AWLVPLSLPIGHRQDEKLIREGDGDHHQQRQEKEMQADAQESGRKEAAPTGSLAARAAHDQAERLVGVRFGELAILGFVRCVGHDNPLWEEETRGLWT